ncbi:BamA/TamA family outer membrane protein [Croceibacterium salegens]|uniref:BamA/TamA family outer membrane protein n=1 Tax=Croceibacterium salegens TaxID=1737568 RepID=UPI002E252AAF|nr:BamA/TamA family outer membrane protein [Croceibacterium salegens]
MTEETIDQAETARSPEMSEAEKDPAPMAGKSDMIIAPIPISTPSLGGGLAVFGVLYYNPNGGPKAWSSGGGAGYTSSGTWFAGGFHEMSLADDRIRFKAVGGFASINSDFYGIGADAGSAGISVKLHNNAAGGYVDLQTRPFKKGFLSHVLVGGRISYLDLTASIDLPNDQLPDFVPDTIEQRTQTFKIGPSFTFDTRNDSNNPSKGVLVEGTYLFSTGWLGGDYDHRRFDLAANGYFKVGESSVLAIRRQACIASGSTPYFDLCQFGSGADLRGYEAGRYRDRATWAIQAEWRRHLKGKFGMAAFFGVGGIAASGGDVLKHSKVLVAGGIGARYLASKEANVNLRVDVAYGKDGAAFYVGIGEAF